MSLLRLQGLEFYAYHGHLSEEQVIGNKFVVDVSLESDTSQAEETDELSNAINYKAVYDLIKMEMSVKSKLLEHVASRIIDTLYDAYPNVSNIEVTVSKLHPPLNGKADRVSVTLSR